MSKLTEIFNSTTVKGRANVAKATYASFALLYVVHRLRNRGRKANAAKVDNGEGKNLILIPVLVVVLGRRPIIMTIRTIMLAMDHTKLATIIIPRGMIIRLQKDMFLIMMIGRCLPLMLLYILQAKPARLRALVKIHL
ncbi:uncharacterized protein LOC105261768 isoform X2 [Musca domestica]|uniref:Uncharacterized protein LOC105261768 isoform X2 n=1 Tax=Musca domestica TaxID=7370 RepID=A0ABM3UNB0_MUSDO|nr:uncharacterized protein LOC105261768 isoform X2 [Musca domestica]